MTLSDEQRFEFGVRPSCDEQIKELAVQIGSQAVQVKQLRETVDQIPQGTSDYYKKLAESQKEEIKNLKALLQLH